jgi:hypothetical protein
MPDGNPTQMQQGSVPVPDPTVLTTENLRREILGLRELLETKLDGIVAVQREKFLKVDQQFELVERQRVEQKKDTQAAVDAALTAQKEAVKEQTTASERAIAKSESGTTRQLEQLAENFRTANVGIVTSIDDLKDRVRGIEAVTQGANQEHTTTQANANQWVGYVIAAATVVGLVVTIVYAIHAVTGK